MIKIIIAMLVLSAPVTNIEIQATDTGVLVSTCEGGYYWEK